ncbi:MULTISPECIES: hypothetical protein [unclassified Streptomyces]|uniref:hypothetical protein n=1 Tax=unclassified Streptomyces TaxID=2593676 RepID=UPI000A75AB4B|nr:MULTISPECIES: hypothetical protein [unclassified Streptomyces]
MDEQVTPSQAEGERDDADDATAGGRTDVPHPTPSQAEGEREPDDGPEDLSGP